MKRSIALLLLPIWLISCEKSFSYEYLDTIWGEMIRVVTIKTDDQDKKRLTAECRKYVDKGRATKCVFFMKKDKAPPLDELKKLPQDKRIISAMNEIRKVPHTVAIVVYPGINKVQYEWWSESNQTEKQKK